MTQIMAKGRHSNDPSPIQKIGRAFPRDKVEYVRPHRPTDHFEHEGCERHDAERVLKTGVGSAWIDEIGDPQLVNVVEPLKRERIDQRCFVSIKRDEAMYRVINFFFPVKKIFCHNPSFDDDYRPKDHSGQSIGPWLTFVDIGSAHLNKLGLSL